MSNEHRACGDQRSVRCVPRELLDDLRSKVIQYVSEAKYFSAEIHQIAGKPPQLVLSLDGNTAGVDNNTNSEVVDNDEKTNIILVQNIPPSLDEEVLELFFESKKKKGGGPVKHVKLDREKNWAIIEFYEPEAVDIVLSKRPITLLDTPVDIQPYLPLLSRDDHLTSLDIQGLPSKLTEDLLAFQLSSIISPATMVEENHQADELSSVPDERVTETITNIRELHLRYLQVSDFQKRMKDKFPNLSYQFLPKTILFEGHASEIEAVKVDLNAFVDSLSIHTVDDVSKPQLEIIQSKQAINYITKVLKSLNLVAVSEVNNSKLMFCCSQDSVMFCQRVILESVKMKIVTTPPDSSVLYTSDLWRAFVTSIDIKYFGLCRALPKQDKSGVTIVATDNVVEEVAHEVQMFLTDHAIVQQTVTTENIRRDPERKQDIPKIIDQALKELTLSTLFVQLVSLIPVYSIHSERFIVTFKGTTKGINQLKGIVANKHKIKLV